MSIVSHMPACWRAPVDHEPAAGRPPGAGVMPPTARSALPTLWLAVAFQPACGTIRLGTLLSSSSTVQKSVRAFVFARTRATSAGDTNDAWLPKLLRMNDAIDAIHSSSLPFIGIMTFE